MDTDVKVLEERLAAHKELDENRFETACRDIGTVRTDVAEIKDMIRDHGRTLQSGFERVHGRIDDEAGRARALIAQAKQESAAAVAVVAKDVQALERGGRGYVERALIFACGIAIASIAYLIVYGPPWATKAVQSAGG